MLSKLAPCGVLLLSAWATPAAAGVLPEDRADAVYHVYHGDGITVQGPAFLVRKKYGETLSVTGTYETDSVTGASIDSRTSGASSLKEHRKQYSIGPTYMRGKTTYNVNFLNSKESDYISDNVSFGISEDMFGDLTTVTLGFTRGWDDVSQTTKTGSIPKGKVDRRSYRLGLAQILTKSLLFNMNFESGTLDGYLQNPYRRVRFGASNATVTGFQDEKYPRTRTFNAIAIDSRYYLPYRASVQLGYRYYTDSWGIVAHTGELEYVHPIGSNWTLEGQLRYYTQTHADFYADLFPFIDAQNFLARDKMLATFDDWSVRIGGSWRHVWTPNQYGVVSVFADYIQYNYKDFKDADVSGSPAQQPLFSFGANVFVVQYAHHF